MRSIEPRFAAALLFAGLTLMAALASQLGRNPYYLVAAAALALATYVTYPPSWMIEVGKILAGAKGNNERK